jgi:UDP-N-acetylmuramoyl-L-alanyl-D-glutamate--2,6-diaminopimelate ligase
VISLGDLISGQPDWLLIGDAGTAVCDIQYDSRAVTPGALFVALRGGYADGHDYVQAAVANGAVALMVEWQMPVSVPQIVVPNSRRDLAALAATFYGRPAEQLDVIGVTGTDGKTTTSYILDHILRSTGRVTGVIGTVSVRIADQTVDHETRQTTPESAEIQRLLRQMVDSGVSDAIIEATSHGLDLHRLDHVRFAVGVATNITQEHLEHHKTRDAYWRAKARLFERVSDEGGVAVVNWDDEGARSMSEYCKGASRLIGYSIGSQEAEIHASIERTGLQGSSGRIHLEGATYPFELPLIGTFNVSNALAALGAAVAQGVDAMSAVESLSSAPPVPGRMVLIDHGQPFSVVVDYAHTPESLRKVLTLLRDLRPDGRLIAVYGSAGERDAIKRPIQGRVVAELADISIITNEDPRYEDAESILAEIAAGAYAVGGEQGSSVFTIVERRDAIRKALELARPGDTVLLAGKGHERSIIWNGVKHPWDEASVASEELAAMGWS